MATAFHNISIVYLPLIVILNMNLKKKKNIFILLLAIPIVSVILISFIRNTKYIKYFVTMWANDGTLLYSELLICISILIPAFIIFIKL